MLDSVNSEDFYEDDEPIEKIRDIASRSAFDGVTVEPLSVVDVAAAILERLNGSVDAYKLQKLCYYAQARHLATYGGPLFKESIEAWANGPVVPRLYQRHRKNLLVTRDMIGGNPAALQAHPTALNAIDRVIRDFGNWTGYQLSELTHREQPWHEARQGLAPREAGSKVIRTGVLRDYYRDLANIPADEDSES